MLKRLLGAPVVLVALTAASADILPNVVPYYEGTLSDGTYVYSYDLQVTVTGDDAWLVAGGTDIGEPWISVYGGTFYQSGTNDADPPDPDFMVYVPDSEYTSFYTTHLGYPNTADQGVGPGFAYGPEDTDTALNADWFWTPDGGSYPGTFTIARFTIIPEGPGCCVVMDMLIGSEEVAPFRFQPAGLCCPYDLDGDGDIGAADLAQLLAHYGTTGGATYWEGDLDGDDDVDLSDLAELLSLFGTECY